MIPLSGWPAEMRARTLAAYLDFPTMPQFYRAVKAWPRFPPQSPVTRRWNRAAVDQWLAEEHGIAPKSDDTELRRRARDGTGAQVH